MKNGRNAGDLPGPNSDFFERGSSGYSKADEKTSAKYSSDEVSRSKAAGLPASEVAARGRTSKSNYLENTKSQHGREVNESNLKTMREDMKRSK